MADALTLHSDVDVTADGIRHSTVWLNYSSNRSASGRIGIPITVIKSGSGPVALFLAGTHGDEYEGQIALRRIALELDIREICGAIIIVPSLNWPAVRHGMRLSPLDNGNLFRSYSNDVELKPTSSIARYVRDRLLPSAAAVVDFHSGGTSLRYTPCAQAFVSGDPAYDGKCLALLDAFAAPYSIVSSGVKPRPSSLLGVCFAAGIPMITTELGGGGLDPVGAEIGYRGARHILRHLGILAENAETDRPAQRLTIRHGEQVLFAMMDGLLESRVRLGAAVEAGDVVGFLHPLTATVAPAVPIVAPVSGLLVCERPLPLCISGDCLFKIATAYETL